MLREAVKRGLLRIQLVTSLKTNRLKYQGYHMQLKENFVLKREYTLVNVTTKRQRGKPSAS